MTFLMRRDLAAVRARGLRVTSPDGDFMLHEPLVTDRARESGEVDWVVCALKATALEEARALIEPCVGAGTRLLVLMNGLGLEERFAEWLEPKRIFAGLAFTCINRGEPGVVRHLDYGALTLAHLLDEPRALEEAAALWRGARVTVHTSTSLLRARWEKLCWNMPFNGLCVAVGGVTTDRIVADPALRGVAERAMREVVAAGNADLAAHEALERIGRAALIERMFALTSTMGPYRPSTLIDFLEGRPLEVDAMFGEPLRRARALGVDTPVVETLTSLLGALSPT